MLDTIESKEEHVPNQLSIEIWRYKDALDGYLHLDKQIKKAIHGKQELMARYQNEPIIHSNWGWDENGLRPRYTSMENLVINYVDTCTLYDELIESLMLRRQLFNEYLATLTRTNKAILGQGVNEMLDYQACLKVKDIERNVPAKFRF